MRGVLMVWRRTGCLTFVLESMAPGRAMRNMMDINLITRRSGSEPGVVLDRLKAKVSETVMTVPDTLVLARTC